MTQTAAAKSKTKPKLTPEETAARARSDRRETVESLVVALILALLIRAFEAEAFVIPTGSMAPTLMGRHKEVNCPQCGQLFAVNASEEVEDRSGARPSSTLVVAGTCSNCRYQANIEDAPSFKGDRILVMKFPWDLSFLPGAGIPQRWDVVVFKYPEEPETNYIKRLVGLPNEELRVHVGDIFTRPLNSPQDRAFTMRQKPLRHLQAMQILVYDDSHRAAALRGIDRWKRWSPGKGGSWKEEPEGSYSVEAGSGQEWNRLRYRHVVPDPKEWESLAKDGVDSPSNNLPARPILITDFNSYNSNVTADGMGRGDAMPEPHWVGDLSLEFGLEVKKSQGKVRIELVRGGVPYLCDIDLGTGVATLFKGNERLGEPAATGIKSPGKYELGFANVDGRLTLWVDGKTPFGEGVVHDDGSGPRPMPTAADLDPVGIATNGAAVKVSGLVLKRDIYYTLIPGHADYGSLLDQVPYDPAQRGAEVFKLLSDPSRFAAVSGLKAGDFPIAPGRYMMMGDNSPRSKDGRGWDTKDREWDTSERARHEVPQSLLIGKAFFVYWPHGKPFGPDIRWSRDVRLPFRPNVERMKWIR